MKNRLIYIILLIGSIAVISTWFFIQQVTTTILEEQVRSESLGWAQFVRRDLNDLDHLLRGAPPTIQDIHTLGTAKNVGNVNWFKIYDHDRTVVWSADFKEIGDENNEPFFLNKVLKGEAHLFIEHLSGNKVFGHAFLPIMGEEGYRGAIEVSLNLSHLADDNQRLALTLTFGIAALFLLLILITALIMRREIQRERVLKQKAQEAAKARNDFIAMVSHELRTPLNGVLGSLGLLSEADNKKEQEKLIQTATHSTEHLLAIINEIIDFTQVSAHRATLSPIDISLSEFADEIETMFRADIRPENVAFKIYRHFDPITSGHIDLKRLRQIVFNLTSNALKFTHFGKVEIILDVEQKGKKRWLVCEVKDTGIGLSQEDQKVIFNKFQQVGDTMSRQYGGIGLGLSLCKELAELMQGSLSVESILGQGSSFILKLPFQECSSDFNTKKKVNLDFIEDAQKLDILLAEDNQINQKVVCAILEKVGHQIEVAPNGKICLEKAKMHKFDLILMDIQMPHMTGLEATQFIRKNEGLNQHTPIIALSANILPEHQESYTQAGIQACLAKPIKPHDLRQAVLKYYRQFKSV